MEVVVFTSQRCGHCHRQKEWMEENKVKFIEKDVDLEVNKTEFINKGGRGTPLTIVTNGNEEKSILGFNKELLNKVLNLE